MRISKIFGIRSLLLAPLAFALSACNLPSPKESKVKSATTASFTAQAMAERSRALETKVEGPFELPASKIFNLQSCIKDNAYNQQVSGHEFLIQELNKKVTSDKSGCITWAESIPFNYLGESQYIRIERTIVGLGLHKGSQVVAFAINPWSHGENLSPVLNPDDGNAIPRLVNDSRTGQLALQGFANDNKRTQRPLWVEDGRLFISEQNLTSQGVNLLAELRPNVALQLNKMNGETFLRPLMAGSFKSRIKLIHTYIEGGREVRRILAESEIIHGKMENGLLALKSNLHLAAIPTRGQIFLGFTLEAINAPEGLVPFEGIYLLGEYDNIKGTAFLKLHSQANKGNNFKLADYVNSTLDEVISDNGTGTIKSDTYQKPKIEVAQLDFRFLRVGSEKTATREIFYNVKACVRNGIDHKNTRSHTFKITKFRQSEEESATSIEVKTDDNSCINWDESITYKYFECQHYLKGFVTIENKDLGMNEKLSVLINPWESQGVMARDLRYVSQAEKITLTCTNENRARTQIIADGYAYNTLSYNYDVDQFLNLTVTKKVQLRMDPKLLVYSSLANGRGDVEKLRDGIYLLKTAIIQNKDYDLDNTYVSSAERFVNVLNGQINTDLTFKTQDLKALGNRNNLLLEIYPVDESKVIAEGNVITLKDPAAQLDSAIDSSTGLETPTFIGPITLNVDEAARPLRLIDANSLNNFFVAGQTQSIQTTKNIIQQVINAGKKLAADKKSKLTAMSEKTSLALENNLDLINLKDADDAAPLVKSLIGSSSLNPQLIVTRAELTKVLTTGALTPEVAQKLCAFWNNDYFRKLNQNKGGSIPKHSMVFGYECYHGVIKDPNRFFSIEKQLLVKNVEKSQYLKGYNQGFTVGTSFSLSAAHSKTQTRSTSISAKFGISKKFLEIFSVGLDAGYSMSWSNSDSTSASNSINVNTSTSMTVQQSTFKIRVNKYEQCVIVKLNPILFIKDGKTWFGRRNYLDIFNPQLTDDEKVNAMTKGLMLCSGELQSNPVDLIENYYLVAQESSSTQMQDSGDARNRNFFIALRSTTDFERFTIGAKGDLKTPTSATKEYDPQAEELKNLERLFSLPSAARPGIYLIK